MMNENSSKTWILNVFNRAAPCYGEKGCQFFDVFGRELVTLAQVNPGEEILDVATGKGAILFPASQAIGKTGTAIGIDLSLAMITEAQKRNALSSVQLLVMDAEKLVFPSHSFDVIFCGFALFFFPNLSAVLDEFKRVLKPNGKVAVSVWGRPSSLTHWVLNGFFEKALYPSDHRPVISLSNLISKQ
ncbi:MAG: class I SAM-dependent methyltransferase [Chlamydiales bacterium]